MKKLLLIVGTFLLFFSCSSSDDDNSKEPVIPVKKLTTVYKDGSLFYKISYVPDGRTAGYEIYNNGILQQRIQVAFATAGKPSQWNIYDTPTSMSGYHWYTFNGNLITKREIYTKNTSEQFVLSQYIEYTNDNSKSSNNLISAKYYNSESVLQSYYIVNYTDNLGSSTTDYYDASGNKKSISTWLKDDKIAWDSFLDPFTYQHTHNNISISSKNLSTGEITGFTAAFTYDQYGYPLTAKYIYTNGTINNYTFNWE